MGGGDEGGKGGKAGTRRDLIMGGGVNKGEGHGGNAGNKNADIQVSFSTARSGEWDAQQKHTRANEKDGNP